jgi:SPP1 family predicted phage head-tail adaptor
VKCCEYNAGMLRTVIQFQRKTRTADGSGGFTEVWNNLAGAATRGKFTPLSGREAFTDSRINADTKNKLVTRYFPSVTESDRVVIGGRIYNIRYIQDIEYKRRWYSFDLDGGVAT